MISPDIELFFFVCILLLIVIFCSLYALYRHKTLLFKITISLITVLLCFLYGLYCYIDTTRVAHYCIDKQCLSIVKTYKGGGVNAVSYLSIYDKRIFSRFQLGINDHIDVLTPLGEMEDCVCFSTKLVDNKFIIKGFEPVKIKGNLDNIKLELSNYKVTENDILWHDLFYNSNRVKFRRLY
ncbi:MAG: hypothetical protein IJV56_04935 [Neisseriaceae bacterium]|nr:hypothetical protein [Neisseriaceae bacterium]